MGEAIAELFLSLVLVTTEAVHTKEIEQERLEVLRQTTENRPVVTTIEPLNCLVATVECEAIADHVAR